MKHNNRQGAGDTSLLASAAQFATQITLVVVLLATALPALFAAAELPNTHNKRPAWEAAQVSIGVMPQADFSRLDDIDAEASLKHRIDDNQMIWMVRRLMTPPVRDTPTNRSLLHARVMFPLVTIKPWDSNLNRRALVAAKYLLAQSSHYDSLWAVLILRRIPNDEATYILRRLEHCKDANVRRLAKRALRARQRP